MPISQIAKVNVTGGYGFGLYKRATDIYFVRNGVNISQVNMAAGTLTDLATAFNNFGARDTFTGFVDQNVYFLVESNVNPLDVPVAHCYDFVPGSANPGYHYLALDVFGAGEYTVGNLYRLKGGDRGALLNAHNKTDGANASYVKAVRYYPATGVMNYTIDLSVVTLFGGGTWDGHIVIRAQDHLAEYANGIDCLATAYGTDGLHGTIARYGNGKLGFNPGVNITQFNSDFVPADIQQGLPSYLPRIGQASTTATYFFTNDSLGKPYLNRWISGAPQDSWKLVDVNYGSVANCPRGFALSNKFNKMYFPDIENQTPMTLVRYNMATWPPTREEIYSFGPQLLNRGISDIFVEEPYLYVAVMDGGGAQNDAVYKLYDPALDVSPIQLSGGGREEEAYIMSILK